MDDENRKKNYIAFAVQKENMFDAIFKLKEDKRCEGEKKLRERITMKENCALNVLISP